MLRARLGVLFHGARACRGVRRSDWRWSKAVRDRQDISLVGCFVKGGKQSSA